MNCQANSVYYYVYLGSGRRHLISQGASDTRPVQCKVRRFLLALRLMTRRARGKLPVAASTSHGLAPVVTIVRLVDSALATVTVPLDRWSRSYSPGGRGAGNGVALANKVH